MQEADGSVEITTADAVDRSRLTVDSLKWYLCKLAPEKYGDKIDATLSGPDGSDSFSALWPKTENKFAEIDARLEPTAFGGAQRKIIEFVEKRAGLDQRSEAGRIDYR